MITAPGTINPAPRGDIIDRPIQGQEDGFSGVGAVVEAQFGVGEVEGGVEEVGGKGTATEIPGSRLVPEEGVGGDVVGEEGVEEEEEGEDAEGVEEEGGEAGAGWWGVAGGGGGGVGLIGRGGGGRTALADVGVHFLLEREGWIGKEGMGGTENGVPLSDRKLAWSSSSLAFRRVANEPVCTINKKAGWLLISQNICQGRHSGQYAGRG